MNRNKYSAGAAIAAICACLSGCGGADKPSAKSSPLVKVGYPVPASAPVAASPTEPDPATPAASAPVAAGPASTPIVLIDVYGDDGIAGFTANNYGLWSTVTPTEPQSLQALLQSQFNDTGITVANHATGGASSSLQNEMRGMDGNGAPFADRIKPSSAKYVIESHTRNDALGGETLDDYRQYLAAWVVAVRASSKIPVLEESGPTCDGDHPQLAAYVQAMDDAAAQFNVPIVTQYAYINSLPNWQSHMANCLYPDAYLLQIKAQREAAVIAPLVRQVIGE